MCDNRNLSPEELNEVVEHINKKYATAMEVLAGNITPKAANNQVDFESDKDEDEDIDN